ncbi:hypothetical protein [Burkholderia sp. A2]|uniref:hypothetical protein n=1 Tax=Burkholderia sp. A2 TaxID=236253 RepID=UPI000B2F5C60|nr:hypothetical protein [Burkholderia sp. A2]
MDAWVSQTERQRRYGPASFPNLYPDYAPRIERHIRQLVPLKLATVATIGDSALETAGNLVEAIAATTREFNELGAADMMAGMLAQATRKAGMFERWFGGGPAMSTIARRSVRSSSRSAFFRAVPRNSPRRSVMRRRISWSCSRR